MSNRPRFPGRVESVGPYRMYLRAAPSDGEPGVFVHGLAGSSANWTDLMHLLNDRIDGVAPDLPAFGRSLPEPNDDYSPLRLADAVATLIQQRFPGRSVHVFGNSMGGAISVQLAARYPHLVRSLTLVSPALPDLRPMPAGIGLPALLLPGVGPYLSRRSQQMPLDQRVDFLFELIYADPGRVTPQRREEAMADAAVAAGHAWSGHAVRAALRGLAATYLQRGPDSPWRLAERIDVPVLLIYGQQDKLVSARGARRAERHFRHARVMVLADSGHVSQIEHPELVARAWRTLVAPAAKG